MLKREIVARGVDELHSPLGQRVAVLIPCLNEEATIPKVVADFRAVLPEATIYVYDNNSTDRTIDMARDAGTSTDSPWRRVQMLRRRRACASSADLAAPS